MEDFICNSHYYDKKYIRGGAPGGWTSSCANAKKIFKKSSLEEEEADSYVNITYFPAFKIRIWYFFPP